MDLLERLLWLSIGIPIGFVAGYIVRGLQRIEAKVDDVNLHMKKRDERGLVRYPLVWDTVLFFVVVLTAFSAFRAQEAVNEVERESARDDAVVRVVSKITACTSEYLDQTIVALNGRTEHTISQAEANVNLQKSQAHFIEILLAEPPVSPEAGREAFEAYFEDLQTFVTVSAKTKNKTKNNPFPTSEQYSTCLSDEGEKK